MISSLYIDPGSGFTIFTLGAWVVSLLAVLMGFLLFFIKNIFLYFKKHKKTVFFVSFISLACLAVIIGANMIKKRILFQKKVIVLGIDGLSPVLMENMMDEGVLPNFARLKQEGAYRHIRTTNPAQSPVAWAGFSTGQNPGKHGIFDFIIRDPNNYGLDLSLSNTKGDKVTPVIKAKRFWRYATEARIPSVIIDCPLTFPPEKIYGKMLSGMGVPDILGTEGTFTFYTSEPSKQESDVGGKVFHIQKRPVMILELIGPRVAALRGQAKNIKVPFKVFLNDKESIFIEHGDKKIPLRVGQWSEWLDVTFRIDPLRKIKGIFQFYLISLEPDFKLYISPIQFDPRDPFYPISYPKNYSKELTDLIGLYHTQGMPLDTWAVNEKRLSDDELLKQAQDVFEERKKMLDIELNRLQKGILFFYFGTSDTIQHMFWRYTDPQHPLYMKDAPQKYSDVIRSWYKKFDAILGEVMKKMDNDDVLIVLSDHGFATFRRAAHVNTWLRKNGYLQLKDPESREGRELLETIDWSKTRAYAIGFGSIYINQKGRERDGIVMPGKETEALKEEIALKLKGWIDEKYNEPVVRGIYKNEEIFKGPYASLAPDLVIGFNLGYRASWQTALGGVPADTIEDNLKSWSGDHLFDPELVPGVIFANKKIKKDTPSLYDIAPTLLKLIGFDEKKIKEGDFDGEPII